MSSESPRPLQTPHSNLTVSRSISPSESKSGMSRPDWIADETSPDCSYCHTAFTSTFRRHHCRNCGHVFCSNCTPNRIPLVSLGYVSPVRVCDPCHSYEQTRIAWVSIHLPLLQRGQEFKKHHHGVAVSTKRFVWLSQDFQYLLWNKTDHSPRTLAASRSGQHSERAERRHMVQSNERFEEEYQKRIYSERRLSIDPTLLIAHSIPMNGVIETRPGRTTPAFKRFLSSRSRDHVCFSIVTAERTLDLECESLEMRERWLTALRESKKFLQLVTPEQLKKQEAERLEKYQKLKDREQRKEEKKHTIQDIKAKYRGGGLTS